MDDHERVRLEVITTQYYVRAWDAEFVPSNAPAQALTLAQARIRELEKRERTIERIVTELEHQNKVNDGYASSLPKAERATSELWLICNSHTKDRTRELRQALKEASE